MKKWKGWPAMAFVVTAAMLVGSVYAQAPEVVDKPAKVKTKKKKKVAVAGHGGKAKFLSGSQETASERSTRLMRECKGAVNAGVCEGYTR